MSCPLRFKYLKFKEIQKCLLIEIAVIYSLCSSIKVTFKKKPYYSLTSESVLHTFVLQPYTSLLSCLTGRFSGPLPHSVCFSLLNFILDIFTNMLIQGRLASIYFKDHLDILTHHIQFLALKI